MVFHSFADSEVYALGEADCSSHEGNTSRKLGPNRLFATQKIILVASASDKCCFANPVAHLGWLLRPYKAGTNVPSHPPGTNVDDFVGHFETEGHWDLSDVLPSRSIHVLSNLQEYVSLI